MTQKCWNDIWFLDNDCSNNMTQNIDLFGSINIGIESEVKLGSDNKVCVKRKGVIVVYITNGERKTIDDVYYVPNLKFNLLSIGR